MARYQIITLVDVTRSNPSRSDLDRVRQGQQANFNSLVQSTSLRANITWKKDPAMNNGRIPDQDGKALHWIWEFETERDEVFQKGSDPVGLLVDDLNGVPIVDGLNNTIVFDPPAFISSGELQNIWISEIK
jgi:hypothetical protein